jgi:anion-transporting  ArsA/GET3 family ATPase
LFVKHGLDCRGTLSAVMLDRKHTFDDLVIKHASSAERRQRIFDNKFYQYISTSLAGTQEYTAMEKLLSSLEDDRYDLIVLDTPPTSNALDFLDAPLKLVNAIDSPVPRWFVRMLDGDRPLGLLGRSAAFILRGLSRFTGAEFLTQVAEFVSDINDLFGGFRNRAERAYQVLRSGEVAFVVVTGPSTQAVADAVYFTRKLAEYQILAQGLVVNRVHRAPQVARENDPALIEALGATVPEGADATGLARRMRLAAEQARRLAETDRVGIERLRAQLDGSICYTEVPEFERDVHDLDALAATSRFLKRVISRQGAQP